MPRPRWPRILLVFLLLLPGASLLPAPARGAPPADSGIDDAAEMFSPEALDNARTELLRLERDSGIPVRIETVESIRNQPIPEIERRRRAINELALDRATERKVRGLYLLISEKDRVLSNVLLPRRLADRVPEGRRASIRDAFAAGFREGSPDAGLSRGIQVIADVLTQTGPPSPAAPRAGQPPAPPGAGRRAPPAGGGGLAPFLLIGFLFLGAFLLLRMLGRLFSGGHRDSSSPPSPGIPTGYSPRGSGNYAGYGGRGGGFWSSLFGGIGGAMAGNWIYDQMAGRHHQDQGASTFDPGAPTPGALPTYDSGSGGDEIVGADDSGGLGASWDDSGGGDWGGGDSGGGDWGGGGDW